MCDDSYKGYSDRGRCQAQGVAFQRFSPLLLSLNLHVCLPSFFKTPEMPNAPSFALPTEAVSFAVNAQIFQIVLSKAPSHLSLRANIVLDHFDRTSFNLKQVLN